MEGREDHEGAHPNVGHRRLPVGMEIRFVAIIRRVGVLGALAGAGEEDEGRGRGGGGQGGRGGNADANARTGHWIVD